MSSHHTEQVLARTRDGRPRHEQIAAELRNQNMRGVLRPGEQLAFTAKLVERFDAANATIQRALRALKDEGYLDSRVGKGVYVRDRQPLVDDAVARQPSAGAFGYRLLAVDTVIPPVDVAEALHLAADGSAEMRHRLLTYQGSAVELSWLYYPAEIAAGTRFAQAVRIREEAPQVLAGLGFPPRTVADRISARPPTVEEVGC